MRNRPLPCAFRSMIAWLQFLVVWRRRLVRRRGRGHPRPRTDLSTIGARPGGASPSNEGKSPVNHQREGYAACGSRTMNGADRAYGGAATPNDDSEQLETSVDQIA